MEPKKEDKVKGSYVGIHSTGFRDFLLRPELLRAITDCGFEHPSEGLSIILASGDARLREEKERRARLQFLRRRHVFKRTPRENGND